MFCVTAELVGPALARLREGRGFTQAQLGALVGVSGSAVGQWEQGRTRPGWKQLQQLANVFDVTVVAASPDRLTEIETELSRLRDAHAALRRQVGRLALAVRDGRSELLELLEDETSTDGAPEVDESDPPDSQSGQ